MINVKPCLPYVRNDIQHAALIQHRHDRWDCRLEVLVQSPYNLSVTITGHNEFLVRRNRSDSPSTRLFDLQKGVHEEVLIDCC